LPGAGVSAKQTPASRGLKNFSAVTGGMMDEHGTPEYSTASGNDYAQHEEMYVDFLKLVKWIMITIAAILIFMWIFLA
jgi:hypothetical protein